VFTNTGVAQQPVFYLFVAVTILLTLGYGWGRRRNKRITVATFDAIASVLRPKDQQFTNIGGLTGYHANFVPHKNRYIKRVDATLTLLPRQSWLWYPFSRLIRRFDRLFLAFHLTPRASGALEEGHLIEKSYSSFGGAKIENAFSLQQERLQWGGRVFFLYYQSSKVKRHLERCRELIGDDPGPLRHVALVPERDRLFVFLIPKPSKVKPIVKVLHEWFLAQVAADSPAAGN